MKNLALFALATAFAFSAHAAHAANYWIGQRIPTGQPLAVGGTLILAGIDDAGSGANDQPQRALFSIAGGSTPGATFPVVSGKDLMLPTSSNGYLGSVLIRVGHVYPNGQVSLSFTYTRFTNVSQK